MRIETALGAGVVVVLAVAMVLTAFVPGVLATQDEEEPPEPPGDVAIREVNIAAGGVTGGTATLAIDARVAHRRGPAENVTVEFRAIDSESGLVEATDRVDLGTVDVDGERRVRSDLSVPRSGGYRVEVIVFKNGSREDEGSKSVSGVGSLVPEYARSGVEFHRFEGVGVTDFPVVEYSIAEVAGDRVTLSVTSFLTNTGDRSATDLEVTLKARQSDSGIVTDQETVEVGEIRPGRTADPTVEVTVPDDYNYYLDAVVRSDGVVVAAARSAAKLNPNGTITVEDPEEEGGLQVGDFERDDADGGPRTTTEAARQRFGDGGGGGAPGFGVGVAALALIAAAFLTARRKP